MNVLYVTDRSAVGDARFREILRALSGAPALTVELREKGSGSTDRDAIAWAIEARETLGPTVPVLVNRRFDVALAAGASGVHLPSDGLPAAVVRAHTPRGFRVGVSTHSPEEAAAALDAGADLVVIGPIFDTPSKRRFGAPLGVEALGRLPLSSSHRAEVYAIGGIDEAALDLLEPYRDRIAGVAAMRLIQEASDPRGVAERIAARRPSEDDARGRGGPEGATRGASAR
jgi:thiamine-phosphate pyrophosphorylase